MRRLLLAPALALVLTACAGGDPVAERREAVADVTDAANAGSAESLREAVDDLLSVLRAQVASGELDRAEADRLRVIAERIAVNADLVEPAQEPSPVPTVEEPSPEPTEEEPSPEPTEEEPSPEPTEEPEETEEPQEEEPPVVVSVPPVSQSSPTPAQVTQPASSPKPTAATPSPQPTA